MLTSVDANLHYNCDGPKNIPMFHNVMMVHCLRNLPIFQLPIERLVPTPHPILYCLMFGQIQRTPWALDLLESLPNIPIIRLNSFEFIQPMSQATVKKMMSRYLPAAYGWLIHTIFPAQISTLILYCNPHFPLNLNKEKGFSEMAGPCCGMLTSVPSTLIRQSFWLPLSFLLSKTILRE